MQSEEEKELALWLFKSITPTALRIAITSCIRDKVEFAFEAAQAIAKADFEMRGKK